MSNPHFKFSSEVRQGWNFIAIYWSINRIQCSEICVATIIITLWNLFSSSLCSHWLILLDLSQFKMINQTKVSSIPPRNQATNTRQAHILTSKCKFQFAKYTSRSQWLWSASYNTVPKFKFPLPLTCPRLLSPSNMWILGPFVNQNMFKAVAAG